MMNSACQAKFSTEDKLRECNRELDQRHRVYAWMVRKGKMKQDTATRQIQLMIAIRDDYAAKAAEGPLFNLMGDR